MIDRERLKNTYDAFRDALLSERTPQRRWIGELADSSVSTATAVSAFSILLTKCGEPSPYDLEQMRTLRDGGVAWLLRCQNEDGGWGDTDRSLSNIATTMLVQAAFHLSRREDDSVVQSLAKAEAYIEQNDSWDGLRRRYGKDKTFVVPIMANCALAGLAPWRQVAPLPFELACFPHALFRFLRMPVVSYAIPALVAIGQARYLLAKPWNPLTRIIRSIAFRSSLAKVMTMQPESGGFLEATPLTAFVTMSLAATDREEHPIVQNAVRFLIDSVGKDGGWPIDTNLATWVTTLSVNALAEDADIKQEFLTDDVAQWILSCRHEVRHPFTNADPGGWGWTDLSGAVPDADDTPGALLALARFHDETLIGDPLRKSLEKAAEEGLDWLLKLQNSDGGWPTFCKGWGRLPFDRSGVDLTAHAIRAFNAWTPNLNELCEKSITVCTMCKSVVIDRSKVGIAVNRGFDYLQRMQREDGSWLPLWFGNQHEPDEENPIYGTGRVLLAYTDMGRYQDEACVKGVQYLLSKQNKDGGWGGGPTNVSAPNTEWMSSIEETSIALEALASIPPNVVTTEDVERLESSLQRAADWLGDQTEQERFTEPSPIGFYFAKLWYYERLYPLTFGTAALGRLLRREECEDSQ
jgi:squalene-hopene/tetraprenyl-beta-curcumene cyclase